MRESFVFYRSFFDNIAKFHSAEAKAEAYEAIAAYGLYGEEPEGLSFEADLIFGMAKPQIDANNKRANDGSKGGRPKKPVVSEEKTSGFEDKNHRLQKKKPNENVNVNENANANANENENVNENVNGNENGKVKETPPTPTPNTMDSDPEITFRYGEAQNVILTDMEHKRLVEKYGTRATDEYIERLSAYMDTSGKQYQGKHFSVIQQWMRKDNVPQISAPLSPSSDLYARALKIMEEHKA